MDHLEKSNMAAKSNMATIYTEIHIIMCIFMRQSTHKSVTRGRESFLYPYTMYMDHLEKSNMAAKSKMAAKHTQICII
jgi:hypothetical protein